jgi:hypothetical protein
MNVANPTNVKPGLDSTLRVDGNLSAVNLNPCLMLSVGLQGLTVEGDRARRGSELYHHPDEMKICLINPAKRAICFAHPKSH